MALSACTTIVDENGQELLSHGTTSFPAAFYHDDFSSTSLPWHWHEELEVFIVTEGSVVISVGTEKYTLLENEGCFINTEVLHAAWNADDTACRFHSIVFHPRLVGGGLDSIFWQKYLHPLITNPSLKAIIFSSTIPWQKESIEHIENAWQCGIQEKPGYEFEVRHYLSKLLYLLISNYSMNQIALSSKKLRDGARIKTMLQFIEHHYTEEITIAQIAESSLISVSECLRCFKSTIGTTPIQYLKQYRLQKAKDLLSSTTLSISEIGSKCGFQEMSYFSKIFKQQYGTTPGEYRKRPVP